MNIERQIRTLRCELYARPTIPCALLGRMVRDTECCSRGLQATVEEFQTCRACPRGHELAAMSPLPQRNVLPMAPWPVFAGAPAPRPLLFPTRPASSKAEPAAPRRWIWFDETMPWPPRPTSQAKPVARPRAPHPMMAMQEGQTAQEAKAQRAPKQAKPKAPRPERQARLIPAPRPEAPRQITGVDLGKPGGDKSVEVTMAVRTDGTVAVQSAREIAPKPPRQPKPKAPRPELQAKPVAKCRECGWLKPRRCTWPEPDLCGACAPAAGPVRPKHLAKPRPVAAPPAPAGEQLAPAPANPRLEQLVRVLRELTADGRMRVSMLDLMRSLGASSFDEAHSLVLYAGLRTSQLYGPVQSVIVDHNLRALLGDAASGVRQ